MDAGVIARRVAVTVGVCAMVCLAACSSPVAPPPAVLPPAATSAVPATPANEAAPATETRSAGERCRLDDLDAQRGDGAYLGGRNEVRVVWTNRSGRSCVLTGFGGVDLLDAAGRRISAARADEVPDAVTLAPGGSAHSTISYPAAGGTDVFSPTTILATPPDETRSARLDWGTGGVPTFQGGDEVEISPLRSGVS